VGEKGRAQPGRLSRILYGERRYMKALREIQHKLNTLFNRVTDWLLIIIGVALIVKAVLAVDVPLARYVIIGLGGLLVGLGLWYRRRRKRRHR